MSDAMPIRICRLAAACAALVLAVSCAQPLPRLEPDDLLWPLPPSAPRVKYIRSIYTEDDIGREYTFLEKLFGKDYYDGLMRPYGVSFGGGKIYVSDLLLRRVLIFDLNEKRLSNVGGEGGFRIPAAAVPDARGNLYVADSLGGKVAVYDSTGVYRTAYFLDGVRPVGLAVNNALGRLYVVDRLGHRVVVLGLDGSPLFQFGARGGDVGKFNMPLDIAIDRQGNVHVLDSGNFRVQTFTSDGAFISAFGVVGDVPGTFANPKSIAVDSEGHLYVTDAAFSNFQIFDAKGNIMLHIGEAGFMPGFLQLPGGIFIDDNDRIYVADQMNARIQVFQYLKEAEGKR